MNTGLQPAVTTVQLSFSKALNITSEDMFETFLWKRLQALADLDHAVCYTHVCDPDTSSPILFKLKEEAFILLVFILQAAG